MRNNKFMDIYTIDPEAIKIVSQCMPISHISIY